MLLQVESSGVSGLGFPLRVPACLARVVQDREIGKVTNFPPSLLDPQTQIGLVTEEKEALVHESRTLEGLAPDEHERTADPVAFNILLVDTHVELPFTEPRGLERESLRANRFEKPAGRRREASNRWPQLPVLCDLADANKTDGRTRTQPVDQSCETPVEDLGIRVEKEDPPGIQRAQCTVVGLRKTSVDATHDPSTRELGLDQLTRFVGRFVVDDDDVEHDLTRMLVDSRQTPT